MKKSIKPQKKEKLKGIGGWLIIPIIGLFLSIILVLYDLLSMNAIYEFDFYIGLLSLLDIGLLILVITSLVLVFNKKKSAPKLIIAFYITNIILQTVVAVLIEDYSGIAAPWVGGAIWILYFLKSKRVKNTFIN